MVALASPPSPAPPLVPAPPPPWAPKTSRVIWLAPAGTRYESLPVVVYVQVFVEESRLPVLPQAPLALAGVAGAICAPSSTAMTVARQSDERDTPRIAARPQLIGPA